MSVRSVDTSTRLLAILIHIIIYISMIVWVSVTAWISVVITIHHINILRITPTYVICHVHMFKYIGFVNM